MKQKPRAKVQASALARDRGSWRKDLPGAVEQLFDSAGLYSWWRSWTFWAKVPVAMQFGQAYIRVLDLLGWAKSSGQECPLYMS